MIENIKLLIGVIAGLIEALPQTNAAGKIDDVSYATLIAGGVAGVIKGAGFQVEGFSDEQIAGATEALVSLVLAWTAAPRLAV